VQDFLAILIAAAAAGYLARKLWLRLAHRSGGGCDSCSSCGSGDSIKSRPLMSISLDKSHAKAPRR
jgi:hypothetical protein